MIKPIFNTKDATIYEQYTTLNTGLDPILELQKVTIDSSNYNSRILLQFDTSTIVSDLGGSIATGSAKYFLKLYATEPKEIPVDYTIYAYPVSGSWNMGSGRYGTLPSSSDGVSWKYRLNDTDTSSAWTTSSYYPAGVTGSWATNPGGGDWKEHINYTESIASQSYSYQTTDIEMDVTNIVVRWIVSEDSPMFTPNNGFIIKKSDTDEQNSSIFGSLKFFSKDSHTIYQPRLEIRYDDSAYHTSHSVVSFNDEVVVNITNLQSKYTDQGVARLNISTMPKYPSRAFSTSSYYLNGYQLPSTSYYSIVDAHTDEPAIDFDTNYTKLSADSNGSYFRVDLSNLFLERYYKVLLKVQTQNSETYIYDKNWIFKISK